MATFEEKAERLKKELEEATNDDQRRNLSREYELTLRLLRIIRGEVFTLDDINKCRMEIMRLYPGYDRPITAESGILLAAEAIRKSFGKKYYLPLYKYPILIDFGTPDARTAGVNGLRSMILDAPRIDPPDWNHDHRVIVPASRRTVWEVSVRDFSQDPACGVRNAWRGKFMAFTQKGTTLSSAGTFPTCLDYLKRLGVGYVQLMPIFDFGSVDESRPLTRQYNWGYDPTNYNVPEGSYSTDPAKGEVRVRECKEMIAALHAAGIGVIMDVVYNHMYRSENPLNSTVPYYFFRQNPDGSFSNGSGCGNEFASERPMARKYLIDSVLYWAQEYHIDGFRFDLMGLYDVDTMNELRAALDALPGGRSILMYGEPWQSGGSQLHRYEANKANLAMLSERIGVFCDNTRDVIKGGCFDAREPAIYLVQILYPDHRFVALLHPSASFFLYRVSVL